MKRRRKFRALLKAKVSIEAIKERISLQELASKFEVHSNQISSWKREFLDNTDLTFSPKSEKEDATSNTNPLYIKIGQLQIENDFLKKVLGK